MPYNAVLDGGGGEVPRSPVQEVVPVTFVFAVLALAAVLVGVVYATGSYSGAAIVAYGFDQFAETETQEEEA